MKRILSILALSGLILAACNSNSPKQDTPAASAHQAFGDAFESAGALPVQQVLANVKDTNELSVLVEGKVATVCKAEGCWLTLEQEGEEPVMVKMKDHKFMVPMDCEGKKIIIKGSARKKVTSVEELKHLAEDAGKTPEEIAAIATPKEEVNIYATGVQLY